MTKLEVGIKQFCCVPKYDGFDKKTILFTRKVTWVIELQVELTSFRWNNIFTWKDGYQNTMIDIKPSFQRKQMTAFVTDAKFKFSSKN